MKKTAFLITSILAGLIILTILFPVFISSQPGNYVSVPEQTHTYTKAVCNNDNYCQDYEIFCENKNIIGIRFTGAAIQFPESWQDIRDEETRNENC